MNLANKLRYTKEEEEIFRGEQKYAYMHIFYRRIICMYVYIYSHQSYMRKGQERARRREKETRTHAHIYMHKIEHCAVDFTNTNV